MIEPVKLIVKKVLQVHIKRMVSAKCVKKLTAINQTIAKVLLSVVNTFTQFAGALKCYHISFI